MKWAMAQTQPRLSAGAKMVLMVLADGYNQKAERGPYFSLKTISRLACIRSRTTVLKHIEDLELLGLVQRYSRSNSSNVYALSGAPDFKVCVQKLDNETSGDDRFTSPVSEQGRPILGQGGSESEQRLSNFRTQTTKTNYLTHEENHASAEAFSADEDDYLEDRYESFALIYPREPIDEARTRETFLTLIKGGADLNQIMKAAHFANGETSTPDPATWLESQAWERK